VSVTIDRRSEGRDEPEARAALARLRRAREARTDALVIVALTDDRDDARIVDANGAARGLLGLMAEASGAPAALADDPLGSLVAAAAREALRRGGPVTWAQEILRPGVGPRTFELVAVPLGGSEVDVEVRDVSARHRAERGLRQSEARLRAMVESLSEVVVVTDETGRARYVSPAVQGLLGLSAGQAADGGLVVHPDDLGPVGEARGRALAGTPVRGLVHRLRRRDGRWAWVEAAMRASRASDGSLELQSVLTDVTARQELSQVYDAVRDANHGYQSIWDVVRDAGGRVVDARLRDAGESAARALGGVRATTVGRALSDLLDPDHFVEALSRLTTALEVGRSIDYCTSWRVPGLGRREVEVRLVPTGDAVVLVAQDVSGLLAAERDARRAAEELGFVAEHAAEMISVHHPDGRFLFVSAAARELWGRAPAELVGRSPYDFLDPEDASRVRAHHEALADGGPGNTIRYRVVRPDGTRLWVDTSSRMGWDPRGDAHRLVCISVDASARMAGEREAHSSRRRASEQEALRRVATAIARQPDVHETLGVVAREAAALLGAHAGVVVRFDGGRAWIVGMNAADPHLDVGDSFALFGGSVLAEVARAGRPATRSADVPQGLLQREDGPGSLSAFAAAAAPVGPAREPWGAVLVAWTSPGTLEDGTSERLVRFAELVQVAVQASEARSELAARASTDPLTGLANHRAFHERLADEVARAVRHGRPLCLALLDLDRFKHYNDLHGHQAGDRALARVAERLREASRAGELVARVGGEEFAWILPESDPEEAARTVERAREAVAEGAALTLSAGVCGMGHATTPDELYRLADGALYWAKANGRDRVCIYAPEEITTLSDAERAERLEREHAILALRSLARAVDAKDPATHAHSERVAETAAILARRLGWPDEACARLHEAALLHDVGKIAVPDAILRKPGPLTGAEAAEVRRHAALGADIVGEALRPDQGGWIRHHHEHWRGGGYPDDLSGERIPEGARILAVADAWDVMTRVRHYGSARPEAAARAELRRCSGRQFWPPAVQALLSAQDDQPERAREGVRRGQGAAAPAGVHHEPPVRGADALDVYPGAVRTASSTGGPSSTT
jgi:diguanylate cyclase (GGDEF)-like protein/PAS domain S-box-containing protein